MSIVFFEELDGVKDGSNTVFNTPGNSPYAPGRTMLFWRGMPRAAENTDGYFETDPLTGAITMKQAPLNADIVQLLWLEPTVQVEVEVTPLAGSVISRHVVGALVATDQLSGFLVTEQAVGILLAVDQIAGTVRTIQQIIGTIECNP